MAQFRATIKGARGSASRLGHKTTGLWVRADGWHSGIAVSACHIDGKDVFEVYKTSGSGDTGHKELVYKTIGGEDANTIAYGA